MSENINVVPLRQPNEVDDPLTSILRSGRSEYEAKNRRQTEWHMWEAVNHSPREPIVRLLPYLRVKRRQGELALMLINLIGREKAGSRRPLTEEQEQARALLYDEALRLNESRPNRTYR